MITAKIGDREIALTKSSSSDSRTEYNFTEWKNGIKGGLVDTIYIFSISDTLDTRMELFSNEEMGVHVEIADFDYGAIQLYNDLLKSFLLKLLQEKSELKTDC